jgi:hypothetical protein
MALQLGTLRDALIKAGAGAEAAAAAAEEVASYENRLAGVETKITLLLFMVGGLYAVGGSAIWLLVRVAAKVGAIG